MCETTEYWSFLCVEEGSLSRKLAFDRGHGYAQEELCHEERERQSLTSN